MPGLLSMISVAATRPLPSARRTSCCDTTPTSEVESIVRMRACSPAGNALTTRSTVAIAPFVCRVPNTSTPVSAAVSASEIVSRSRISPTRIASGSSRSAECNADANDFAWVPISRCEIRHCLRAYTNSIGSSIVMMWPLRVALISSISAARVVDLPEPVGPVVRMSPRLWRVRLLSTGARFSSSADLMVCGTTRSTAPMPPTWRSTLTRKRARPGISYAKSSESLRAKASRLGLLMISCSRASVSLLESSRYCTSASSP